MTVSSQTSKSGPYFENGVTTEFEYEFAIRDASHIKVVRAIAGVESVLTLDDDYTVTGVGNAGGGFVIVPVPSSGSSLMLVRNVPFTQELDLENQGAYFAEDVEAALDLGAQRDQQLAEEVARSVKVPVSSQIDPNQLIADLIQGAADAVAAASAAEGSAGSAAGSAQAAGTSASEADESAMSAAQDSEIAAAARTVIEPVVDDILTVSENIDAIVAVPGLVASFQAENENRPYVWQATPGQTVFLGANATPPRTTPLPGKPYTGVKVGGRALHQSEYSLAGADLQLTFATSTVTSEEVELIASGSRPSVGAPGAGSITDVMISDDAVTNSKLANMAAATMKGRAVGAGTGDPGDLTATQARSVVAQGLADASLLTYGATKAANGAQVLFDQIPAWVRRVSILFDEVSLSTGDYVMVRVGTAAGLLTTASYRHSAGYGASAGQSVGTGLDATAFYVFPSGSVGATLLYFGVLRLTRKPGTNVWVMENNVQSSSIQNSGGGRVILPDTLDRVAIFGSGGVWDAGDFTVIYE